MITSTTQTTQTTQTTKIPKVRLLDDEYHTIMSEIAKDMHNIGLRQHYLEKIAWDSGVINTPLWLKITMDDKPPDGYFYKTKENTTKQAVYANMNSNMLNLSNENYHKDLDTRVVEAWKAMMVVLTGGMCRAL